MHCAPRAQTEPEPCSGTQLVPLQKLPAAHCASALQLFGQVAEPATHRYGAQVGLPGRPPGVVQVPGCALHTSQVPPQALEQHTPSAQKPLEHSTAVEQPTPLACLAVQVAPLQ